MKLLLAIVVVILIVAGSSEYQSRVTAEADAKAAQDATTAARVELSIAKADRALKSATATDAAKQLATLKQQLADEKKAHGALASKYIKSETQLAVSDKKAADLTAELAKALTEAKSCPPPSDEVIRLKKQLAALKGKDNCPPPDEVPAADQPQPPTPWELGKNGKRRWMSDFDEAEKVARALRRKMYLIISTTSCPHCDNTNEACRDQRVIDKMFANVVPCWVTIVDAKTRALAKRFGVYEIQRSGHQYGCPAGITRFADGDTYTRFRPGETAEEVLETIDEAPK